MIQIKETNDFKLIARLNEEIQDLHHSLYPSVFKPYDQEKVLEFFQSVLSRDNTKAFIAEEEGNAIGYILFNEVLFQDNPFQYSRPYVLIDQILVLKQYQFKGVGKMLLEAAYTFANDNGIHLLELNHWTLNENARYFFNKNGFKYYNEKMWRNI